MCMGSSLVTCASQEEMILSTQLHTWAYHQNMGGTNDIVNYYMYIHAYVATLIVTVLPVGICDT